MRKLNNPRTQPVSRGAKTKDSPNPHSHNITTYFPSQKISWDQNKTAGWVTKLQTITVLLHYILSTHPHYCGHIKVISTFYTGPLWPHLQLSHMPFTSTQNAFPHYSFIGKSPSWISNFSHHGVFLNYIILSLKVYPITTESHHLAKGPSPCSKRQLGSLTQNYVKWNNFSV